MIVRVSIVLKSLPVSVVVAEIVMQNIEEQALATYKQIVPLWLRYVDDTFTAVHKDEIDIFHEHLNRQNADIQFTREVEDNGKIPFLDCLVSRHDNKLQTTIYRKPTHTNIIVNNNSSFQNYTNPDDHTQQTTNFVFFVLVIAEVHSGHVRAMSVPEHALYTVN